MNHEPINQALNYQDQKTMNDELTTEQRFIQLIEKLRPYIQKLWQVRWKLIIFNAIVMGLTLIYLIFIAVPYYESKVIVLPEFVGKSSSLGGLQDIASMAGLSLEQSASTNVYEKLIYSESVFEPVITAKYKTNKFKDSVNLYQYYRIDTDSDSPEDLENRKRFLKVFNILSKNNVESEVDRMTKILTIRVTMPESQLSAEVANNLAASLDNLVRNKRKSFVSEQKIYISKRINEVQDSLTIAEEKLKIFREQNRIISNSPQLLLEQGRFARNVEILQTVYLALAKQLEIVKIDEIRDTPIVNVLEIAREPIQKASPKRLNTLILYMFFSFLFSAGYFLFNNRVVHYYNVYKNAGS
jgi:uncharacterized protein involved in exopolysaccharide biosynthesis